MHPVKLERLTRDNFLPFGHVIDCTEKQISAAYPPTENANQGYARRSNDVAHLVSYYGQTSKKTTARTVTSLFVALPRVITAMSRDRIELCSNVFERHPFTSQTFIPMGLAADDEHTAFIVVVTTGLFVNGQDAQPDLGRIRAFLARGDQAITYLAGVWHAPLIVVGRNPIKFVAIQYMCGQSYYDCEEEIMSEMLVIDGLPEGLKSNKDVSKL